MSEGFDLDLRNAEAELDTEELSSELDVDVVLGILDGSTPPEEWTELILDGAVCILAVEGDLNELAAPFAADVNDEGATLMHFRDFLVISPPGVKIDADRL